MNTLMKNIFTKIATTVATGAALSVTIAVNAPKANAASFSPQLIREDLLFGRNIPGGGEVSDADFQAFLSNVITPRFPDGLTIFDANQQYLDSTGTIITEKSKDVAFYLEDTPQSKASINEIVEAYLQQFNQESVRLVKKDNLKVSFGQGELFDTPPTNKFMQTDLFFGRNIARSGEVSEEQFQGFLNDVITPSFPDGLTIFDANGQYKDSTGTIIKEKSKNVAILFEDTAKNEASIYEIVKTYNQQFQQESVLQAANQSVKVSFGVGDLFDKPPTNKFIKTDLFFGRNIPGGGEVSDADFQAFLNNVITPRFPDGLTIFNANGQYKDSTSTIIKEKSKEVSLFFEDNPKNEASIYEIVKAYKQQFNQESVLQVADEDVEVAFIASRKPTSIPEPAFAWGLLALGVLGAGATLKKELATVPKVSHKNQAIAFVINTTRTTASSKFSTTAK